MGGETFETTQPESYLFGENNDFYLLGNRRAAVSAPRARPHAANSAHFPRSLAVMYKFAWMSA